jgi:hypothetical protein
MESDANIIKWFRLSDRVYKTYVSLIFSELSRLECRAILIKGWANARHYSSERIRPCTDIDILFPSAGSDPCIKEIRLQHSRIAIDAHFGPRDLDNLSFDELYSHSYETELNGVLIRVLADEDNLRLTAVHWLVDGGVNKEKLWDIYYLIVNRKNDFDWDRCLESNGPIRKTWVVAAIATARDHLDLDVSDLPQEVQDFTLPEWYERTLAKEWRLGIYPRRILSTVIFRPTLLIEQLRRKLPPNRIAATIDSETSIDDSSRIPAQIKSLTKKLVPFARGLGRRITYLIRGKHQ